MVIGFSINRLKVIISRIGKDEAIAILKCEFSKKRDKKRFHLYLRRLVLIPVSWKNIIIYIFSFHYTKSPLSKPYWTKICESSYVNIQNKNEYLKPLDDLSAKRHYLVINKINPPLNIFFSEKIIKRFNVSTELIFDGRMR